MLIVYGSRYGSARRYAEELARRTGGEAVPYKEARHAGEDTLVYFGGVYAGGVKGLARTARRLHADTVARILVATVGLADPADEKNAQNLRGAVFAAVPAPLHGKVQVLHLRGGIDYAKLSAPPRFLMKLLYSAEKRTPPEKRGAEARAIVETYGKAVDFTDFSALDAIADRVAAENRPNGSNDPKEEEHAEKHP